MTSHLLTVTASKRVLEPHERVAEVLFGLIMVLTFTGSLSIAESGRDDALFQSLSGNEEHQRPKFFVPFESLTDAMRQRARPLNSLIMAKPGSRPLIDEALRDHSGPRDKLAWLPVHYNKGFWTAIVDTDTMKPVRYVDLDPY